MSNDQVGIGGAALKQAPVTFECPECGWSGEFDSRFARWCESCGFAADPAPREPEKHSAARRRARARVRAERMCDRLATARDLRPTTTARVATTTVATLVHLATLVLLVCAVAAVELWSGRYWWAWALGGMLVLIALAVRPQLWRALRKPKNMDDSCLTRADATALFGLLDTCAHQLQAPAPDYVMITSVFNAGTRNVGLRHRKLLVLGAPLWSVLTGPQRVALLGHELAHHVNGDVTHGVWVRTARLSLIEWIKLFHPRESQRERVTRRRLGRAGLIGSLGAALSPLLVLAVTGPIFLFALACYGCLTRLDLTCGQRAEHLADELGARLGSSAAAIQLVETLALADSAGYFLRRQKSARSPDDPWPALRAYLDSIPDHEKRRRMLLDERHGVRIDATHPANYLRRKLLTARPQLPAAVEVDATQWAAIDRELDKHYALAAHEVLGRRRNTASAATAAIATATATATESISA